MSVFSPTGKTIVRRMLVSKKALVTGGAGFVGSYVTRQLLKLGYEVYLYDSFVVYLTPTPGSDKVDFTQRIADIYDKVHIIRGNTLDKDFLRRQMNAVKPDVVVHLAAMPLAALAIEHTEEAFQTICTSTQNILEILRDFDHPCRLLYVSSSMIYGDFVTPEVDEEDHPKDPKDVYGAFKLAGEIVVRAYGKNYGLDTVICRPSAVYGPFDANARVIRRFILNAMEGKPLTMDGDGSMKLDFTYIEDCAAAIALAADSPAAKGLTFNVTRGEGRSLRDLAEIVQGHFPGATIEYRPKPAFMPMRGTLSIARARRILGYESRISLEEGVRRYVEHLQTHAF